MQAFPSLAFFSFAEITDPAMHRAFNEYHQLDHRPANLALPCVHWASGSSGPRRARRWPEHDPRYSNLHYVNYYLFADTSPEARWEWTKLGSLAAYWGRKPDHVWSRRETGFFETLSAWAHPHVRVSPAVLPMRPHRGIHVTLEELSGDPGELHELGQWVETVRIPGLLDCRGVAGAWTAVREADPGHARQPSRRRRPADDGHHGVPRRRSARVRRRSRRPSRPTARRDTPALRRPVGDHHTVEVGLVRLMLSLFATPLSVHRVDSSACAEAAMVLVAESAAAPTHVRSIVGGWHGAPDLPTRTAPVWKELTSAVAEAIRSVHDEQLAALGKAPATDDLSIEGWGTVLPSGGYVIPHDHAGAQWSAVCYLDVGDPPPDDRPEAGSLVLLDPRGPIVTQDLFPPHCTVTPETGLVVVFPGWVTHFVHPYVGERPRVSAAFNAVFSAS